MGIIKRDGNEVGAQATQPTGLRVVAIATLVPLEGAVVSSVVESYRAKLRSKEAVDPPAAVEVDDELLIVDGNHRVYARLLHGDTEVEISLRSSGGQLAYHERELGHALRRGRKGFDNVTEVADDEERTRFTTHEHSENEETLWTDELLKMATNLSGENTRPGKGKR